MVANTVSIGPGVSIGAGWGIGISSSPSFTVTSADISSPVFWGVNTYSAYSSAGFTSDPGGTLYQIIQYTITPGLESAISAAFSAGGLNSAYGYAFQVSWQSGGTGLIRVALDGLAPTSLLLSPIDISDPLWQSGDLNSTKQAGTFAFPATFTLYQPVTSMSANNSYC
jgi:hypothetical protein